MTRVNNRWTPENDEAFTVMWKDGLTITTIQRRFNIGQASVEKHRWRLGLLSRIKSPHWTDESAEQLHAFWLAGKSATEIARIMGGGLTRNAVIGKLHRLGLTRTSRPADAPPLQTGRTAKARRTLAVKVPKPLPVDHKPREKAPVAAAERSWQTPVSTPQIQRAQRAYGQTALQFVESGAGVQSPNARPFMEATGCKWPLGPRTDLYCCNPVAGGDGLGRSYCAGHFAASIDAKQPPKSRRDASAYLTRFDRIEPARPAPANNNASIWDMGRAA